MLTALAALALYSLGAESKSVQAKALSHSATPVPAQKLTAADQAKVDDLLARAGKARAKSSWPEAVKLAREALKIAPGHAAAVEILRAAPEQPHE